MTVTHPIRTDLVRRGVTPRIYAMQDDTNTRVAQFTLTADGAPWNPPAEASFALSYRKPDGTRGLYDRLSQDISAVSVQDNAVSVVLAHQVLTCPGTVEAALVMADAGGRMTAFPFEVHVAEAPGGEAELSEDFFLLGGGGGGMVYYSAETTTTLGAVLKLNYAMAHDWSKEFTPVPKAEHLVISAGGQLFRVMAVTDKSLSMICLANLKGEDGAQGEPGQTPVRGVDYFTEADKAEMVDGVIAALNNADEVSY